MGIGLGITVSIGGGGGVPAGGGDSTAPAFVSAAVSADGTELVLTYDEELVGGAVGDFSLSGTYAVPDSLDVSGTTATLAFAAPLYVTEGDTVTVDYTPGGNPLRDAAGNAVDALSGQAVTNNSTLPDQLDTPGVHTYSFTGDNSGQTCSGRYWFPADYDPAEATTYPILFAFHGKGGSSSTTNTNFIPELEAAITAAQIRKCIVIMPDSNGADWGTDATGVGTGTVLAETKIVQDVIPYFQARTRQNGSLAATGFSMGGWTATVIGMRNDGLFDGVWGVACPNMDSNPTSGNANNWRWVNSVFSDLGANDTDDVQAVWGPTSTGGEQTTTLAALTADSPLATATGGALANTNTADIISGLPLFYCKSAGDAVSLTSLNAMTAGYTALNIPHGFVDLVTPGHSQSQFYGTAQDASSIAGGNGFMWLEALFAGSDVKAPQISDTPTINTAGTELTITFDKTLTSNSPTAAQFTLGGVPTGVTVSSAAASGTTVVLTLNAIIAAGASGITVSMASADAATKVLSAAGVPAAPRTSVAVTNNSTATLAGLVTSVSWHYLFEVYTTASITESSGAVSAVTDQSGAGHNLSQATAGCRPTYSATSGPNSTPGITHDGADGATTGDFLASSSFDVAAPATTNFYELLVFKQVAWANGDRITARPGGNIQIRQAGTTPAITMNNTTGVNSNTAATIGSWFRLEAGFTGSTSDFLKIGSTNQTGASAGNNDPASGSSIIGAVAGGTTASNIAWTVWGATAGIPNGTERANIDKFLLGKYGTAIGM